MDFITQIFSDTVLYALGWTVIHSLWQGTLLAVFLSILMMALEKQSARLRYEVACGALFTMLMMSLATFIIYLDQDLDIMKVTVTLTGNSLDSSLNIHQVESNFLQTTFQSIITFFNDQLPLIVNVWLIGFLFFAFRMIGGIIHLNQLRHHNNFPADQLLQNKLNALIHRSALKHSVKIVESDLVKVPILIGHLKPLILIPIGTINLLTEEEVEAVLAHELAHIMRRDFSMNIFFTLVEILFYYHPGVWLMAATVRTERENCCDDLALFLCKNPLAYARALYKLEAAHKATRIPGLALSFSSQKNQLLHRVRRILNQPQNKSNIMEKLITTSFLLLTIAVLSIGASTPLDKVDAHRIITTGVETLSHPVVYVEATNTPPLVIPTQLIAVDTVPLIKKDRRKIIKTENGRAIEITMEDGQISNLIIDGKEIPAEEYEQHEKLVEEMVVEFDNIPSPPPAPPTPPTLNKKIKKIIVDNEEVTIIEEDIDTDDENIIIIQRVEKQMEEHQKTLEKQREKLEQKREEMLENHEERMEEHRIKMEEHKERMLIKQTEMEERMEEISESGNAANKLIAKNIGRANNTINTALEDQLLADGLIDSRENYQFELTGKKLKVNRNAQSDAMHQKYKQLYGELSGTPLSDKSKIKLIKSKN